MKQNERKREYMIINIINSNKRKKFKTLARQFVNTLDQSPEEKRKKLIKDIPVKPLRLELMKIYNIK